MDLVLLALLVLFVGVALLLVVVLALLDLVRPSLVVLGDLHLDFRLDLRLDLRQDLHLDPHQEQWGYSLVGLCQTCG